MSKQELGLAGILRSILIAIIVIAGGLVLWAVLDAMGGASSETVWNHTWEGPDGKMYGAYVARPDTPRGTPRPGVLLIHEWWGLNLEIARLAEALAADGYVVLAPDAYGGRLAVAVPGALFLTLTTSQRKIDRNLDVALQYLREMDAVDPGRVAVAGFCFGGTQAMNIGTRDENVAATAIFYGSGIITEAQEVGSLGAKGPVLGIFGGEDRSIPADQVQAFESAVAGKGVDLTVRVFPEQGHAFVNPESIMAGGAAREAWNLFRVFLRDNLAL